ncbi:hypothetical protein PHYPSEUDO_000941 [Phytophthora pseudosyringae]|uniref:Uncharacterized protein n=1 Tax=Phytophthora pseudosyringae TaxID=221518 RepID=A0A8T1W193_9STRA|nr:hypothetical protein PHYPSEUDO_000941 [Phytophthora pseudosyringae]
MLRETGCKLSTGRIPRLRRLWRLSICCSSYESTPDLGCVTDLANKRRDYDEAVYAANLADAFYHDILLESFLDDRRARTEDHRQRLHDVVTVHHQQQLHDQVARQSPPAAAAATSHSLFSHTRARSNGDGTPPRSQKRLNLSDSGPALSDMQHESDDEETKAAVTRSEASSHINFPPLPNIFNSNPDICI